jgi:phosphatidylglycerophosphatase C
MQLIAIYDLDKTILRTPTFTVFLMFAAKRLKRAIWWRMPLWIAAMAGYACKIYGRKTLKSFGMKLFIGPRFSAATADNLAQDFTAKVVPDDVLPGAAAAMAADKAAGYRIIIASAAQAFYTGHIGAALGADAVLATENKRIGTGDYSADINGENNYAAEKLRRAAAWLSASGLARDQSYIRAYSDHISDAPLLDWADEAVFVTASQAKGAHARSRGWQVRDFEVG